MGIDEAKFAEIYDEFAPKIFKYCYFRVSSREEAEDIASQVFIRAWDHIAEGKEVTNVQGFLYRIASNLIIDFYRKRKDKREISLDDPDNPIDIPDASDVHEKLEQQWEMREVKEKLDLIPENYREVIVMKYVDDLSIKEIASVMETTENNISVRLHRAIEKLKSLYEA
ncbi:MAG: RNA polymerase sigma factor [Patescibacteria group bacterium]